MSDAFTSVSKFRVQLLNSDGSSDRVIVQIGLDGFKVLDASSNRALRSLELGHISRWQSRGNSLVLHTRTPADVEERQLTLQGDEATIRNTLDTLTCSCMQLAELLQSKQNDMAQETASSLHALVAGGGKKKSKLPTADEVEYWRAPEKSGWLQCQGEHLKSWRKRWFVLKQGFLFRFMTASVTEATKPRGVVDLSKVQDVKPASSVINKPNSLQLKTSSGGSVCYVTDTETELVEWMSALEGAVQRICRHAAGVDEEAAPQKAAPQSAGGATKGNASEWMKQLERTMESFEQQPGGGGRAGRADRDRDWEYSGNGGGSRGTDTSAMVQVIGYETLGGGGGGGSGSRPQNSSSAPSGYGAGGSGLNYGQIAGANTVMTNDTMLNYRGAGVSSVASDPYLSRAPSVPSSTNMYGGGSYSAASQQQYGAAASSPHQHQAAAGSYFASPSAAPVSANGYSHPGSQAGLMSLIDQVPQQQPTYPYYQQTAAPQVQAPASSWQVHYTGEGRPYYHNPATGSTQWEAPVGFA